MVFRLYIRICTFTYIYIYIFRINRDKRVNYDVLPCDNCNTHYGHR